MKDKSEILTAINLLYRRWNAFESKLGKMGFPVLDFDYCPDPQNDIPQFQDRLEILSRLGIVIRCSRQGSF